MVFTLPRLSSLQWLWFIHIVERDLHVSSIYILSDITGKARNSYIADSGSKLHLKFYISDKITDFMFNL